MGRTRQDVSTKLAAALKAQQDGVPLVVERQSFSQFASSWLTTVRPSLKPRTWYRYEQLLRVHALPAIGRLPLSKLAPQQLQALYAEMQANGSAPATIRQLHAVVHRALRQALRWNLVARNVADLVTAPRVPRTEMQVLSPEEARCLLEAARGDRLEALYVLALTTGMRQGEILALHWKDVDLDRGTVNVRFTLHHVRDGFVFTDPKSSRSRRQIALTEAARSALRQHRIAQAEERLRAGPAWQGQDLVFANPQGGPLDGTFLLRRRFHPLLGKAGLPKIRFHDLRHTAATLLLGQGIHAKIVSEMLGHSNIAITMDLYSHVTPTMQQEAARALDALLARP
ncbi:MAG: site-specific integrase [Dehalococcoidia bacterium]|nr:site-specific integrase [Dehalococcoidia bacterium]